MSNKIKGPVLTQPQIDLINMFKEFEEEVLKTINMLENQVEVKYDQRWLAIGKTDLQKGFMGIIKGIAQGE